MTPPFVASVHRLTFGLAALTAALTLSSPALATGIAPGAATPVQREQAQGRFARGKELYARKEYAKALDEFLGSHEIVASPNARLYAARCYRELGKLVLAYEELGRVANESDEHVSDDPRYARTADAARAERDALAPRLGFVTVDVANATPETRLLVAGDEIRRAGWSEAAPVVPGETEITVDTPGRAPVRTRVKVAAGERQSVRIDAGAAPAVAQAAAAPVEPAPAPHGNGLRTAAFVALGVGVAGVATFAVAGTMADGTYTSLNDACKGGPCPPSKASDVQAGKTQQTVANVGLAVGAVGVAAGLTLFVVSLASHHEHGPEVAVVGTPSWLGVRGAF